MEKLNTPRELRGLAILSVGNTIKRINRDYWTVKSQTGIGEYTVCKKGKVWLCSCPDYHNRELDCKHIFATKFSLKLKTDIESDNKTPVGDVDFKPDSCPHCDSNNIIKRGVRKTKFGDVQRYCCKDCNKRFVVDHGFSRMKHDPKAITLSMDLYFKGISYRKIVDHLKQFYNLHVSQTTPMRWVKKYLKILSQYSEKYQADVGNIWHSDETTLFIKKEGEKKYYEWIWNIMDAKTRYLLACRVTKDRFVDDAVKPLKDAKNHAKNKPDVIVTDGLQAYKKAIKKEFYDKNKDIHNPHLRLKDFQTHPNNNIVERLNGTFRERSKVMRSLSTNDGANTYVKAMQVYYNYIRPHQSLNGKTPSEMANIPIDLDGNRWLKMIRLATMSKMI